MSGLALSVVVLAACGYLAFVRSARTHLDRVSFRLLVYALVSHVIFGILGPLEPLRSQFNLLVSTSIFFCVALNLMLVLVYNVNGRMMEKYYIMGSLVLSGTCFGSAYASGHLGLNTKNHICWYNNENQNETLRWVIGTQMFWMLLLSAAEFGMFLVVVAFLLPFIRHSREALHGFGITDAEQHPIDDCHAARNHLADWQVAPTRVYPLVSCVMNIIGSVLAVWQLKEQAEPVPVSLLVYSMRPLVYSMIAATDPSPGTSFVRAWQARRATTDSSSTQQTTQVPVSVCLSTLVDFTVGSIHGAESDQLDAGSQTQIGNLSLNPTESLGKVGLTSIRKDEIGAVGVAEHVGGLTSAQWDVARQI
ncbi:hypothetical protein FB45DRAFT_1082802 [Roridomyces roridus]|uniref:Uncharacterized protein n=1 Tax=Roridomyces roridus TaxID=1738132 RepID=A0AAD7FJL4_9AGAR|nr:hypothetical protein FB45DRAFT_1082802 [Roridomyces roridus]